MLKIAVFDNKQNAKKLESVLVNILFDKCEFGYEAYTDPLTALNMDFTKDFDFDIVFIEISADSFPGIEIARRKGGSMIAVNSAVGISKKE